jgi:hypothetical protein
VGARLGRGGVALGLFTASLGSRDGTEPSYLELSENCCWWIFGLLFYFKISRSVGLGSIVEGCRTSTAPKADAKRRLKVSNIHLVTLEFLLCLAILPNPTGLLF